MAGLNPQPIIDCLNARLVGEARSIGLLFLSQYSPILLKLQKFSQPSHFYLKPETPYAKIGKNKVL